MTEPQLIAHERAWGLRLGIAGIGGFVLFMVGTALSQTSDYGTADTQAGKLLAFATSPGQYVIGQIILALAFVALAVLLFGMFRSIQARTEINRSLIGLAFLGPLLWALASIAAIPFLSTASSDFDDLPEPQIQSGAAAVQELESKIADDPDSIDTLIVETEPNVVEYRDTDDNIVLVSYPEEKQVDIEDAADEAGVDSTSDGQAQPGELAAQQTLTDSSGYAATQLAILPAVVATIIIVFYVARMAMRVGLQTQFWGTFGMAGSVASLILGPIGPFIWGTNAGWVAAGLREDRRPPGWAAGEARPWPRPGGSPIGDEEDSGEQPARPEDFEGSATETTPPDRSNRREARHKRKRKQRGS